MKKNIIVSTVLFALSLLNAPAQDKTPAYASVVKSMESSFNGASNVRMEPFKNVVRCKFLYLGKPWLAFFAKDGSVISAGREIKSANELPFLVQSGLSKAKASLETKFGATTIVNIYEMMEGTATDYYVTFDNQNVSAIYAVTPQGSASLKAKQKKTPANRINANAIAQKD